MSLTKREKENIINESAISTLLREFFPNIGSNDISFIYNFQQWSNLIESAFSNATVKKSSQIHPLSRIKRHFSLVDLWLQIRGHELEWIGTNTHLTNEKEELILPFYLFFLRNATFYMPYRWGTFTGYYDMIEGVNLALFDLNEFEASKQNMITEYLFYSLGLLIGRGPVFTSSSFFQDQIADFMSYYLFTPKVAFIFKNVYLKRIIDTLLRPIMYWLILNQENRERLYYDSFKQLYGQWTVFLTYYKNKDYQKALEALLIYKDLFYATVREIQQIEVPSNDVITLNDSIWISETKLLSFDIDNFKVLTIPDVLVVTLFVVLLGFFTQVDIQKIIQKLRKKQS